jgi:paraquat-inducible protein A
MKPAWNTLTVHVLLIVSCGLFLLGVFSPLLTVKQWFLVTNTLSLWSGLMQLVQAGHYLLFLLVLTFSLIMPLVKMSLVAFVNNTVSRSYTGTSRVLHWLSLCGKWSMIEVFIVAILVVVGKVRGMAAVEVHAGLYAFAASVLLLHLATCRLDTRVQRRMHHKTMSWDASLTTSAGEKFVGDSRETRE